MVCMKSSTGVMIRLTRSDSPAQIPSGMLNSSAMITADRVSARVSMLSCHSPCSPTTIRPAAVSSATFALATA
jgi:hypothetical protein